MMTTKPSLASSSGPRPARGNPGAARAQSLDWMPVEPRTNLPAVVQAITRAAELQYQKQRVDAARDFLALLEPLSAHTAETLETLGNLNFLLGDFGPAAAAYRQAIERHPRQVTLWVRLALTSRRLNDFAGVQAGLDRALALEPSNVEALKLLGDIHLEARQYREAAMAYGQLVGRHPDQPELFLLLAKCFFEFGDRTTTRSALQHVLELQPGNAAAEQNLLALGPEPSRRTAAPAPASPNGHAPAKAGTVLPPAAREWLLRADAAYAKGQLPVARDSMQQALRHAPQSVQLRVCLGNLQFQLADFAGAFESYRMACASSPANVDALVRLAATALRLNRVETFEQSLARALELDPQNPAAQRLLADTNFSAGRHAAAAAQYTALLDEAPNDAELLLLLGNCRYKLGDRAAASQCFERVLEINPRHVIAKENLEQVRRLPATGTTGGTAGPRRTPAWTQGQPPPATAGPARP